MMMPQWINFYNAEEIADQVTPKPHNPKTPVI